MTDDEIVAEYRRLERAYQETVGEMECLMEYSEITAWRDKVAKNFNTFRDPEFIAVMKRNGPAMRGIQERQVVARRQLEEFERYNLDRLVRAGVYGNVWMETGRRTGE